MKINFYSVFTAALLTSVVLAAAPCAQAQKQDSKSGPSKYIYLSSVSVKPGMMGQFRKLQEEEDVALREAKAPGHFMTMEQITGSGLLVTLYGFDSFADMQKVHEQVWSNAQLAATLRRDNSEEGALTKGEHDSIYMFRKDLSLHTEPSLEDMRFMRLWLVHVKPGHAAEFESIAKTEMKALASRGDVHWAVFEKMYGVGSDDTFLVATPLKSLGELDTMIAGRAKMRDLVGEGLVQLVRSAESKSISSSEEDLFVFAPRMSYVPDSWVEASPDFWGEK